MGRTTSFAAATVAAAFVFSVELEKGYVPLRTARGQLLARLTAR